MTNFGKYKKLFASARNAFFASSFAVVAAFGQSETRVVGTVTDAETGEPLPHANVAVVGTALGAAADLEGAFSLAVPNGAQTLAFSVIGYRTERRAIKATGDTIEIVARLESAAVELGEVVVTGETPGERLMRRAMERRLRQEEEIETASYTLYAKFVASADTLTAGRADDDADTTIVAIFETFSDGYFRAPDYYHHEIFQRRQSVNVPPQANFLAYGGNLSIYAETFEFLGETIYTPFDENARDFYDFEIVEKYKPDTCQTIAVVRVTPRTGARKLFEGEAHVCEETAAPLFVDLVPNRSVQLPFDAGVKFQQRYEVVDGFVALADSYIYGSADASFLWIFQPRVDVEVSSHLFDHRFNPDLDDARFNRKPVVIADEAETFDEEYWSRNRRARLAPEEERAYALIRAARENPDSVLGATIIDKYFGAVTRTLAKTNRPPATGYEDFIRYNAVTGVYLGVGFHFGDEPLAPTIKAGYGFADARPYGELGFEYDLDDAGLVALDAVAYKRLARRDDPNLVDDRRVAAAAFLFGNDYGDYYRADGGELGIAFSAGPKIYLRRFVFERPSELRLFARLERQSAATNATKFSIFRNAEPFRPNPAILEGDLFSLGARIRHNYHDLRRRHDAGFSIKAEYADRNLGGDFSFQRYEATARLRTRSIVPLWTLDLRLDGGVALGDAPPQRFFSLESAVSSIARFGVFRGMDVKEFYGDRFAAAFVEHNFGEVIPGLLRIPNVASFGVEFLATGAVGWTDFAERTRDYADDAVDPAILGSDGVYYEAGVGLNRLLIFLRLDFSARLSQTASPVFRLTVSTATF